MSEQKRYLARVYVALKPTVNDPEGITIAGALAGLLLNYRFSHARAGQFEGRLQYFPFAKPMDNLPLRLEPLRRACDLPRRAAITCSPGR